MRVAADLFATVSIVGQQLGLVANADLTHLNPSLKLARQRPNQVAKIDSVLRQIINDDSLAAEEMLDVDQLHVETHVLDLLLADLVFFALLIVHFAQLEIVLRRAFTENLPVQRVLQLCRCRFGRFAEHLPGFQPAIGAGNYACGTREGFAATCRKDAEVAHHAMANDVLGHDHWTIVGGNKHLRRLVMIDRNNRTKRALRPDRI